MSETKFTRGATVEPCSHGGGIVVRGDFPDMKSRHPQSHLQVVPLADAHLFAAASDLYAALEAMVAAEEGRAFTTFAVSRDGRTIGTLDYARLALQKARGEQP